MVSFSCLCYLLEVAELRNGKGRFFAGVMLPAMACAGIASSSTAFATRKARVIKTRVKSVSSDTNKKEVRTSGGRINRSSAERIKRLRQSDSSGKDSGKVKETMGNNITNDLGKNVENSSDDSKSIGDLIDTLSGSSESTAVSSSDSLGDLGGLLGDLSESDIASLGKLVENVAKSAPKDSYFASLKTMNTSDGKVRLATKDVLNVSSSDLASAYGKAIRSGYFDINFADSILKLMPGINEEMVLSGYFDSQSYMANTGVAVFANATNISGEVVGQLSIMPDPSSGEGAVKLQLWATDKENFESTLRLALDSLGSNGKIKRVSVSALSQSGKGYKSSVKSIFDEYKGLGKPVPGGKQLYKKFNEVKRSDYMRLEENSKGQTVLVTGSARSVNGAKPIKDAPRETVLKSEEISNYKNMIKAGKMGIGSGAKEGDAEFLSVASVDYEFVK